MHGYISVPPSRAYRANLGEVPGAGEVQYEPQSVLAAKGSLLPNGGGFRFSELNDESLWADHFFTVPAGIPEIGFTWTITAPTRVRKFSYYMITADNIQLTEFDCHDTRPPYIVEHIVPLGGFTGRQTILGVCESADLPESCYQAVDLFIESGD